MTLSLVIDSLLSVLLVAMITYAVILNRRLGALRANKAELLALITSFNEATFRAETSIQSLKRVADDTGRGLQQRIDEARGLRDDLAFMTERGGGLADRLERSVRSARSETKPAPPAPPEAKPETKPAGTPAPASVEEDERDGRSLAERELLKALRSVR